MQIKQSTAFRIPIVLVDSNGNSLTGVAFGAVTCFVQKQAGSSTVKTVLVTDWTEIDATNFPGVYDLLLSTTETNTVGWLKVSAKTATSTLSLMISEIVANIESDTFTRIGAPVAASISADIANVQSSTVAVSTTAATGSTSTQVRTPLTQADGFFNGMTLVVVHSTGVAARIISTYANTNGAFNLTSALPFTPSVSDTVLVLANNAAGIWDDLRSNHVASSTYGELHNFPTGTVVTDGANTTTTFHTSRTEAVDDYWKNSYILFTSGALANQVKRIGAYTGATKFVTLDTGLAFTTAPSGGDSFILIDR